MTASALRQMAVRPPLVKRTVRLRLTLLYGTLFLASGAALLAITYGLVDSRLSANVLSSQPVPRVSGRRRHGPRNRHRLPGRRRQPARPAGRRPAPVPHPVRHRPGHHGRGGPGPWLAHRRAHAAPAAGHHRRDPPDLRPQPARAPRARRPRDELTELADTIDGLLARLDAAFGSQRRFVANASHELRTPLMLTQTLLQVALADPAITLGSLRDACHEVLAACKEQDRLIRALLTLARSQRGLDNREPLDLADLTRHVLHAREHEARARGLRVDAALGPAPAAGDLSLAEILISNLIDNAIRHNVPGGHIQITTAAHASQATLTVANTGPHVPAAQAPRLLEPFQRLDGKRGHHREGLGLGLSIVAAIADAHNAELSVHPRPAGGLAIEVTFPLIQNDLAEAEEELAEGNRPSREADHPGRRSRPCR